MTWQKKHHWSTNCSALSQTFRACSKRVFAALQIECSAMFLSGNNLNVCPIYQYLLRVQISMSRIEKSSRFVAKSVYIHILRQGTKGAKKYFQIKYHFQILIRPFTIYWSNSWMKQSFLNYQAITPWPRVFVVSLHWSIWAKFKACFIVQKSNVLLCKYCSHFFAFQFSSQQWKRLTGAFFEAEEDEFVLRKIIHCLGPELCCVPRPLAAVLPF